MNNLVEEINKVINTDIVGEEVFEFDNDIKIVVAEYKTTWGDGYACTFQELKVDRYTIKCNHFTGEELLEKAKLLRQEINEQGLENAIDYLTIEQDQHTRTIREWK